MLKKEEFVFFKIYKFLDENKFCILKIIKEKNKEEIVHFLQRDFVFEDATWIGRVKVFNNKENAIRALRLFHKKKFDLAFYD